MKQSNTYFERIDMRPNSAKHSLRRQSRTPRQHRVVMNRMGKIFRLFKPDGTLGELRQLAKEKRLMSNVDWY